MSEKMLVCDALDERDFLAKKIKDAIRQLQVCAVKRRMDGALHNGMTVLDFDEKAKKDYQSITDMITRHTNINKALIQSNANTKIHIKSTNEDLTIAEAISIKKLSNAGCNLAVDLATVMSKSVISAQDQYTALLRKKDSMDERYRETALQNSTSKALSDDEVKSLSVITDGYTPELIDPLNAAEKVQEIIDRDNTLIKEIESAIKVSNATTYIEF